MQKASITATAMGIYTMELNGKRVEDTYWILLQDTCLGWLHEVKAGYRKEQLAGACIRSPVRYKADFLKE